MSARAWALATAITGGVSLALFGVFATLPEVRAAADCLAPGAVVQFELARNAGDLTAIFGAPDSACRSLAIAAMNAVNRIDVLAFIPAYTLFCISAALFLANGIWRRPLVIVAVAAALFAAAADYLETTTLLAITQTLDAPGGLLHYSQTGAWSKFALLAAHAVFCSGLCFTSERPRLILGVLLLLPAFGVAAAAYDHATLASAMNGAFAIAWIAMLALAIRGSVKGAAT